jgi:hypothetical protein
MNDNDLMRVYAELAKYDMRMDRLEKLGEDIKGYLNLLFITLASGFFVMMLFYLTSK